MVAAILLLLLTAGASSAENDTSSETVCSYQQVLNYLNLTKDNELFTMSRPVRDYQQPTVVNVELLLFAILDVKEVDQTFVPYVRLSLNWNNDYIFWNMSDFCYLDRITVPSDVLWKPDITIKETREKEKAPQTPYLIVTSDGTVKLESYQVLVSACKMQVHKFPFDIQNCSLTLTSLIHSADEMHLLNPIGSEEVRKLSAYLMKIQYEWLFIGMDVQNKTAAVTEKDEIVYTISMRRKPVLYIVNFLLPVLFLFFMDLASFLISDAGGEKLGFKVTILLAVTVMQLILHEILPSSSHRIPLIALYCIGIFALMLLSLLETIVVMYLLQKDDETPAKDETDCDQCQKEACEKLSQGDAPTYKVLKKWTRGRCICNVSTDEASAKQAEGGDVRAVHGESAGSEKLPDGLMKELKTLTQLLSGREEDKKPGYWAQVTKKINKVFLIFYVTTASLFFCIMYLLWLYT